MRPALQPPFEIQLLTTFCCSCCRAWTALQHPPSPIPPSHLLHHHGRHEQVQQHRGIRRGIQDQCEQKSGWWVLKRKEHKLEGKLTDCERAKALKGKKLPQKKIFWGMDWALILLKNKLKIF